MNLKNILTVAAIGLVLGLAIAFFSTSTPSTNVASADDPTHVTSLGLQSVAFPPSSGLPTTAVVATLDASADPAIHVWSIDLYHTPLGMSEGHWGEAVAKRSDGETVGVSMSVELTAFPSGTHLRAVYNCLDGAGAVLWTYQRILTVP